MADSNDDPKPSAPWGVPEELSNATKVCDQTVIAHTPELARWVNDNIVSAIDKDDLSRMRHQFREFREERERTKPDPEPQG